MNTKTTYSIRSYLPLFLIIICVVIIGKLLQFFVLWPLLESGFNADSFEYINKIIAQHRLKDPEVRNLSFYKEQLPKYINRLIFLGIYSAILLWIILRNNFKIFKEFIFEERSALALALLRVSVLILILYINFPSIVNDVVSLGPEAVTSPFGWSDNIISLLINPELAYILGLVFQIFCIGALLGIITQKMLLGATITGFFVMAIPQFFGKIDHYHILWHVLLILSFCRSGDSLSIDAWRRKLPQINITSSVKYGLPIKLIMILIGLVYFFPGFWKFIFSGLEWVFSDNLQLKLHSKWLDLNGWTPAIRIDRYPILYQSGALFTMIIELGFIFALFFRKVRWIFVLAAFGFHLSVYYFMNIPFFSTMILYVIFIDWKSFVSKLSENHFHKKFRISKTSNFFRTYAIIGTFLISGYILTGALVINSWPFSVYPTFASIETNTIPTVYIEAVDDNNEIISSTIPLLDKYFQHRFESTSRLRGFLRELVLTDQPDKEQLNILKSIFLDEYLDDTEHKMINIYYIKLYTNPDNDLPVFSKESLITQF